MKAVLTEFAEKLESQIRQYDGYAKTQATDAMRGSAQQLLEIVNELILSAPDLTKLGDLIDERIDVSTRLQKRIGDEVSKQLESLTSPAPKISTRRIKGEPNEQ